MSKKNVDQTSTQNTQTKRGIYLTVDGNEISRKEYIRTLFQNGLENEVLPGNRSDIVKYINKTYPEARVIFQQVYQATSDLMSDPTVRGRRQIVITCPDGSSINRRDYIKALFTSGMNRGDIVRHLKSECSHEVSFQIVYQATS